VTVLKPIWLLLRSLLGSRAALAAENLALRQQLAVLRRSVRRPRLRRCDRELWVWLSQLWHGWQSCLVLMQPATVVRWHGQGLRLILSRQSPSATEEHLGSARQVRPTRHPSFAVGAADVVVGMDSPIIHPYHHAR